MFKGSKLRVQLKSDGLAELALFNFDIKYRTGKWNQAADTLSHHPKTDNDNSSDSDSDREKYETISYALWGMWWPVWDY